jgi:hypothetical protein
VINSGEVFPVGLGDVDDTQNCVVVVFVEVVGESEKSVVVVEFKFYARDAAFGGDVSDRNADRNFFAGSISGRSFDDDVERAVGVCGSDEVGKLRGVDRGTFNCENCNYARSKRKDHSESERCDSFEVLHCGFFLSLIGFYSEFTITKFTGWRMYP